jgi:hypothetical protein
VETSVRFWRCFYECNQYVELVSTMPRRRRRRRNIKYTHAFKDQGGMLLGMQGFIAEVSSNAHGGWGWLGSSVRCEKLMNACVCMGLDSC